MSAARRKLALTSPRRSRLYSGRDAGHACCNEAQSFGGRRAPVMSPQQLKEVIQVAHTNVGSVASLGALVSGGAASVSPVLAGLSEGCAQA
jgi:hypothetical protein